jgi:ABC-2 type transport system permease protein
MQKYLTVFAVDWQNQFIYRLNFILWRVRNILRLLMIYFLWNGIFTTNNSIAGYSRPEMLTYVFLVLVITSIVLSAPSADSIGGEIGSGDLSNYLVKPISYLKYWFTRDLSSKLLNLSFALVEICLLWVILKPEIYISPNPLIWLATLVSLGFATPIYYLINASARFVSFWMPENTWGLSFMVIVFMEMTSGMIFPIDVLPDLAQKILQFTPFPYLIFYPASIFLGKIEGWNLFWILFQSGLWTLILIGITKLIWSKGLHVYSSEGR